MDAGFSLVGGFRYGRSLRWRRQGCPDRSCELNPERNERVHAGARRSRLPAALASPYPKTSMRRDLRRHVRKLWETASSRKPDFSWFYPLFHVPRPRLRRL